MSFDRRDFMRGVFGGFLSYGFLKPRILKALGRTLPTFKPQRPVDTRDLSGILPYLGGVQLWIVLDPSAHPDDTIKPGQPLSLRWYVYDLFSPFFSGASPREDPRYASSQITLFHQGNPIQPPTTQRRLAVHVDRDPAVAHDFYQIGADNQVTAELSNTPGGVAVTASFYVSVVRDNAPNWEWGAVAARYRWNRDHYQLTG